LAATIFTAEPALPDATRLGISMKPDRVRRALRRHDGHVEAFVFEIALAERHVPGCMPPQADEIEDELEVALLRLRGGGQQGCRAGGKCGHECDQRSKHVGLPDVRTGSSAPSGETGGPVAAAFDLRNIIRYFT